MHAEVNLWLQQCREVDWSGALVYEVGALNVNGQARDIVPSGWASWIGFDLVEGDGVDFPGDAEELLPDFEQCDVMVSTEVLEHAARWAELLGVMCDAVKDGGWLILTCAGTGRRPHAADGSPGGPHPGEYYENVPLSAVEAVCTAHGFVTIAAEEGWPGDTRYFGKKGEQ